MQAGRGIGEPQPEQDPEAWITVSPPPESPIERGLAGPGLLANVIVRRFDDHLPRTTGWRTSTSAKACALAVRHCTGGSTHCVKLFAPLLAAMLSDARAAPYICIDATGVLVQAPEQCSRGHFWVLVVPGRHVIFAFSQTHDGNPVDKLLGGYDGYIVADAHSVYDHLYGDDGATEVGCWSHARAYVFKALGSESEVARLLLGNLQVMFLLERKFADKPRKQRERMRATKGKALVDRHFALCREHEATALEGTPLAAAIRYSINQEAALRRFLTDGRLPATNNISERMARRQAIGRNNWVFLGSEDGASHRSERSSQSREETVRGATLR